MNLHFYPTLRFTVALAAGLLFGFGLALSEMINPIRVLSFLNVASGHWNPSLLFVLGSALAVAFPGMALQCRLKRPLLDECFHLPSKKVIDRRIVFGSAIFGTGWGLTGLCPGPAIASLSTGLGSVLLFVAAMAAGMIIHDRIVVRSLS
ncbi:YeeE/YedE family protein [Xylella fastidiosa]|uniref:Membrane protein n=1 Tax=Xylella fastidiosa subsp. sandyi Ann-1 TaxID=155920 RepID=A0A060H5I5_XYLFS|nr:YeeE/YedE family protein [Xylella fastidiosa]AIC10828.1 membrane protein [Xylella fastidiosa subsp. sandyi Ann-1]UIX81119.1 YeeE/YedE family protein [Xylella fastidiosa subsp. sandyi]